MSDPVRQALERLEAILDASIEGLMSGAKVDDAAIADAKGRALLELSRLAATGSARTPADEHVAAVARVRDKLARERTLLGYRLDAAALVSRLVAEAVLAEDWDGTYGPRPGTPIGAGAALYQEG